MEAMLRQFYALHNPIKIKDIPQILLHYKGSENLLLENLQRKYGEPGPAALREWVIVDFYDITDKDDGSSDHDIGQHANSVHPSGYNRGGQQGSKSMCKYKQA